MAPVTLTQGSRSLAQRTRRIHFALLCEYLGDLCFSIRLLRNFRFFYFTIVAASVIALWWCGVSTRLSLFVPTSNLRSASETEIDEALQQAATNALGPREGAIIVMDPQTGRVRAIANPRIAFESSFAPGSTIKPFTALAALRAGLIDKNSRRHCRSEYSANGFEIACAHPKDLPPLDLSEAIAYSCNYYFGTLGDRLSEESLSETLASFGFGKRTGVNTERELPGKLLRGKRDPRNALGEGEYLQVTPIQLVTAYSALINGGNLLSPGVASAQDYRARTRAQLRIAVDQRALIIEGMRGAVRYGTAEHAQLHSLPLYIFGKTGTSAPNRGFRSQGWFVGFASDPAAKSNASPESVKLAVLVFLYKGHGAQAAEVAKPIFEEFARLRNGFERQNAASYEEISSAPSERNIYSHDNSILASSSVGATYLASSIKQAHNDMPLLRSSLNASQPGFYKYAVPTGLNAKTVRLHVVRENVTREVPLEDYVLGVVAAEGSTEDQPEALKALAIAARTYALKNLGRHETEGYDFCTLTHCQRFLDPASVRPRGSVVAAVRETGGLYLRDKKGQLADSYFSASCGGVSANMQTLWGVKAPSYLRGVPDEYCATMPHHSWTDVVTSAQLLKALRSDTRTDPGATLQDVTVARRDDTGRAESIIINGEHRRTVSGWDLKIIVGRALGWNLLKSSRFEITRSGANFIFRGSGFGHGLGLCQEGAHVMAQRGAGYQQILAKYFPGTTVKRDADNGRFASGAIQFGGQTFSAPEERNIYSNALLLQTCSSVGATYPNASIIQPSIDMSLLRSLGNTSGPGFYKYVVPTGPVGRQQSFADLLWNNQTRSASDLNRPVSQSPRLPVSLLRRFVSRATLSSEHFRVSYPARVAQRDAEGVLKALESTRSDLLHRISSAGVSIGAFSSLEIFINDSVGDFVGRTGQPWWAAAATKGKRIELQPIEVLKRRGVLETTLRHELVHPLIDEISHGRAPRWLAEGLALYVAGEGQMISRYAPPSKMSVEEIEHKLAKASSVEEMRAAYAAAYREVNREIKKDGEPSLWRRLAES